MLHNPTGPGILAGDRGWMRHAACAEEDPELFFPLTELSTDPQVDQARKVCRRCAVLLACRFWAIDNGEDAGVWGATTAPQRRAIRRAMLDRRRPERE